MGAGLTGWDTRPLAALGRLNGAGFEAFLVGGCVRDARMGKAPHDYDIATSARPQELARVFADCRVVETGLAHGTLTVLWEGLPLEITTYRVDGAYSDGRRPDEVRFTPSLREDAARRDFTINAMAWHPQLGLQDFFGGEADLAAGCIRCVGEATRRFEEDGLRVLRALRFASALGFSIHEETKAALFSCAPRLELLAAERVSEELGKLLCGRFVRPVLLDYWQVLGVVLPELVPLAGFDQHSVYHCWDVLTHTAYVVESVPPRLPLRLAALLHDCGKPACFTQDEAGRGHFYGHGQESARLAQGALTRLRFDGETIRRVTQLVARHDLPIGPQRPLVRRRLNQWGADFVADLLALQRGDNRGQAPATWGRQGELDATQATLDQVLAEGDCVSRKDLAVTGADLLALGFRGPQVGRVLQVLLDSVIDDKVANERHALLALAATVERV